MISIQMAGLDKIELFFREVNQKITVAVRQSLLRSVIKLRTYVVVKKLQGGNPLHHRTGNLQRSTIHTEPVTTGLDTIEATVGTTTMAPYGRIHEYGGQFTVREHARTSVLGNTYTVRSYTATYPQRSYLRTSLAENKLLIQTDLEDAIRRAIQ